MSVVLWVATGMLAISVLLGIIRIFTASDAASRAVVGDLVFFGCIGILLLQGVYHRSAVAMDVALIGSLLGIVATVALARILTRGRR